MISYIDAYRGRFGVEPICRVLQFAPSTYYAAKSRPPSARVRRDEALKVEIRRVWEDDYRVYGADKIWAQLNRQGTRVARCTVERLMRDLGIRGAARARPGAPPCSPRWRCGRRIWSNAASPPRPRIGCGSPT